MYNLIESISNYSETTESLLFYSKDEATVFNVYIANDNNFKPFKYKAKLLGNTEADNANGILKNAIIAIPLKYLSNFRISVKMTLINCKVESKLKKTKYCVLSAPVLIMLMVMTMAIILFLPSKIQNYVSLL